jgi:hypothetical protein
LASIASPRVAHAEPIWTAAEAPADREVAAATDAQQSAYIAASGGLIQFNAIVAAIQGSLLTVSANAALKAAAAGALFLHVLAAFALCWAARPIVEAPSTVRGMAFADSHRHVMDTFRNYRRGWRMTLLALLTSSCAAMLFVLHALGTGTLEILAIWK